MEEPVYGRADPVGVAGSAAGASVGEVCRRRGISAKTYSWKAHDGALQVAETKRLKALEDENRRLKKLVADLSLDNAMLRDVVGDESGDAEAAAAGRHPPPRRLSRAASAAFLSGPARFRARPSATGAGRSVCGVAARASFTLSAALKLWWGYRRLHWLLRREGWAVNHKLVQRIYREEGLGVRKRRRKRVSVARTPRVPPTRPNERWSIDFVHDTLGKVGGRSGR